MENMDCESLTHSTKMGADKLAENTPNTPKFVYPNCLLKPKSLGFRWKKASLGGRSPCPLESVQDMYFKNWASKLEIGLILLGLSFVSNLSVTTNLASLGFYRPWNVYQV